ncbi:MAG: inositol monophosphatase family protein [Candidatus Eisenbacteria bacterium]|nr:inositol monophosphatase family protein [Candidatus Eisenbacteria bacterium]
MLEFAVGIAREAGEMLLAAYGRVDRGDVGYKGWRNLVTETDVAIESHLVRRITERFPDHGILGEEQASKAAPPEGYRWVIDPIDGTTNFVHAHPFFCTSIGLEHAGRGVLGVVFAPYLEELFTAEQGAGASLNGVSCRASAETSIEHALLASGFAYSYDSDNDLNLENWGRLSSVARGLRRCGSAALDLAYVACGRYEGFWELRLGPWDIAAGAVLVTEAGGRVTDLAGGDSWRDGHEILATNGRLHEEIRSRLKTA